LRSGFRLRRDGWGLPCCPMGSLIGSVASCHPAGVSSSLSAAGNRQSYPPGSRGTLLRPRPLRTVLATCRCTRLKQTAHIRVSCLALGPMDLLVTGLVDEPQVRFVVTAAFRSPDVVMDVEVFAIVKAVLTVWAEPFLPVRQPLPLHREFRVPRLSAFLPVFLWILVHENFSSDCSAVPNTHLSSRPFLF
jgi:hypothetical protein